MLADPAHRISRSAVWHWMTRDALLTAGVAALTLTPTLLIPMPDGVRWPLLLAIGGTLVVAAAISVGLPLWHYSVHRWEVTDAVVLTRSGAIFRDWRIVPMHRVQTVEVSQGVLERAFGVARLVIRTASYAGSTEIAGLDAGIARSVADELSSALATSTDDGA